MINKVRLFFLKILSSLLFVILIVHPVSAKPPLVWESKGVGGGGALFSPSMSPHDPDELYVACDMRLLYHTKDFGRSWKLLSYLQLQGHILCKMQFTNDPKILYVRQTSYRDGMELAYPSKSIDGGLTWNVLSGWDQKINQSLKVMRVFSNLRNADHVFVVAKDQLFFSMDGGNTLKVIHQSPPKTIEASRLAEATRYFKRGSKAFFDQERGLNVGGVFCTETALFVGTNDGLLVSQDNGKTFSMSKIKGIPDNEAMVSFCGAEEKGTIRFFTITTDHDFVKWDTYFGNGTYFERKYHLKNIYRMDWGKSDWEKSMDGIAELDRPIMISMAQNNVSTAYFSGNSSLPDPELHGPVRPCVYQTTDGGKQWKAVFLTENNQNVQTGWIGDGGDWKWSWAGPTHGFQVAPNDHHRLVFTDLGGDIFASANAGETWKQLNIHPDSLNPIGTKSSHDGSYQSSGVEPTVCNWVAWSSPKNLFASFVDIRGIRSEDGGNRWGFDYTGFLINGAPKYNEVYQTVFDPETGMLYAACSTDPGEIYDVRQLGDGLLDHLKGVIKYSSDHGKIWQTLHEFSGGVIWTALDPKMENRMYASVVHHETGGIYVSDNIHQGNQSTWQRLSVPPRTEGHPFNIHLLKDGSIVCSYSGRMGGKPEQFTPSSGVFISSDEGKTWLDRSDPRMHYWTKDLVIDPHDPKQNTWYAGVHERIQNYKEDKTKDETGGLYQTKDRGKSWKRIFKMHRVFSCAIHPEKPEEMFVTTRMDGLWYCDNLTSAEPQFQHVDSYPFRYPQRAFYNPYNVNEVWVASCGAGILMGQCE